MDPNEYALIIRHLVQIATHQDTMNERLTAATPRLEVTQARTLTLLARLLRTEDTGRDA
jgi:hypothetical protein